jgi:hypothetical protein
MVGFKNLCGLLSIHGVIDCTQIHIQKLISAFTTNIYSYKLKAHSLQFQVVIDHDKHFVMYLWAYWVPWMTPKYYGRVIFTRKQLTMTCSTLVSLDAKMKFILTFLGTKVPYYHGWWSPINRMPIVDTQFWRLFTIGNFQGKKMFS